MNYIVDPKIFYWMNVINNLGKVCFALLLTIGLSLIVTSIISICSYCTGKDFKDNVDENGNPTDPDWKSFIVTLKVFKIIIPIFIGLLLIFVFIPSKETMIEMLIAKYATVENANWTVDALKSVVDYIIESMRSLK